MLLGISSDILSCIWEVMFTDKWRSRTQPCVSEHNYDIIRALQSPSSFYRLNVESVKQICLIEICVHLHWQLHNYSTEKSERNLHLFHLDISINWCKLCTHTLLNQELLIPCHPLFRTIDVNGFFSIEAQWKAVGEVYRIIILKAFCRAWLMGGEWEPWTKGLRHITPKLCRCKRLVMTMKENEYNMNAAWRNGLNLPRSPAELGCID